MLRSFLTFMKELGETFIGALRQESKPHLAVLFALVAFGVVVRIWFLSGPMRYDEAFTVVHYASKPLHVGLTDYYTNNHLFHTFLVRMAYLALGNKPWVVRLPAFFAGALLVPAAYLVGRLFYNKHTGLLAAAVVASSSVLTQYSVSARGYSLICLLFFLLLALSVYLIRTSSKGAWLLFAVLSALGFYTIPIMLYPFGTVAVWLFLSTMLENLRGSRGVLLKRLFVFSLLAGVLTLVLYIPTFTISGFMTVVDHDVYSWFVADTWSSFLENVVVYAEALWEQWNRDAPVFVDGALVIGFFLALLFHGRLSRYRVPPILSAALWLVPVVLFQRTTPPIRIWLFLLPLYAVTACAGLSVFFVSLERRFGKNAAAAAAGVAVLLSLWTGYHVITEKTVIHAAGTVEDAEEITLFLKDYLRPGDKVMALGGAISLIQYYSMLHDVPLEHFSLEDEFGDRVLVLLNESWERGENAARRMGSTVEEKFGTVFPNYTPPRMVRRYRDATLYEIYRLVPSRTAPEQFPAGK